MTVRQEVNSARAWRRRELAIHWGQSEARQREGSTRQRRLWRGRYLTRHKCIIDVDEMVIQAKQRVAYIIINCAQHYKQTISHLSPDT